jgi:hypothetical protein
LYGSHDIFGVFGNPRLLFIQMTFPASASKKEKVPAMMISTIWQLGCVASLDPLFNAAATRHQIKYVLS